MLKQKALPDFGVTDRVFQTGPKGPFLPTSLSEISAALSASQGSEVSDSAERAGRADERKVIAAIKGVALHNLYALLIAQGLVGSQAVRFDKLDSDIPEPSITLDWNTLSGIFPTHSARRRTAIAQILSDPNHQWVRPAALQDSGDLTYAERQQMKVIIKESREKSGQALWDLVYQKASYEDPFWQPAFTELSGLFPNLDLDRLQELWRSQEVFQVGNDLVTQMAEGHLGEISRMEIGELKLGRHWNFPEAQVLLELPLGEVRYGIFVKIDWVKIGPGLRGPEVIIRDLKTGGEQVSGIEASLLFLVGAGIAANIQAGREIFAPGQVARVQVSDFKGLDFGTTSVETVKLQAPHLKEVPRDERKIWDDLGQVKEVLPRIEGLREKGLLPPPRVRPTRLDPIPFRI